ncbi:MAG: hypothetical protein DMF98_17090 [Acidobacteria bacterium]|nr:MAG: hypothetical protein DMF98_17090 [Acidobacteriota bacterium]
MIWVAVDAMGGDYAPRHVVDGVLAAARHFDLGVALVGLPALLEPELLRHPDRDRDRVRLVEAPDVVGMEESPAAALRRKPRASIGVAADLVARGEAGALFSAGHTGATVMAAYGAFGMLSSTITLPVGSLLTQRALRRSGGAWTIPSAAVRRASAQRASPSSVTDARTRWRSAMPSLWRTGSHRTASFSASSRRSRRSPPHRSASE